MNLSEVKRYKFRYAGSNMYVIAKNGSALVIDPNISEDAVNYLNSKNVSRVTVLLTHEHYDHTSGLIYLCEKFKSTVICHEETALSLSSGRNNRPMVIPSKMRKAMTDEELKEFARSLPHGYLYKADITFSERYGFIWEGHKIRMISTPGHSKGSCCIEIDDNIIATGDSLILDTPVITRFPGGSRELFDSVTAPYLKRIKSDTAILPGHGEAFTVGDGVQR